MSAHTPWVVGQQENGGVLRDAVFDSKTHLVALVNMGEANARLIAAAPDLLAACMACLEAEKRRAADLQPRSPASAYTQDRIARIEAAIAKAEGKS